MRRRIGPFRALGFAFEIRAPDPVAVLFDDAFADLTDPEDASRPGTGPRTRATIEVRPRRGCYTVEGPSVRHRCSTLGEVVAQVIDVVNQSALASVTDGVALHAAAVSTDSGVVALVGPSGSGKSTLAAAMAIAGHGFVADEVTFVRPDRDVLSFHRPIGLRAGGAEALGIEVDHSEGGLFSLIYPYRPPASALRSGGRLVAVALVQHEEGEGSSSRTSLRPAEALVELASGSFGDANDDGRESFRQLARLVTEIPVARLTYDDPADGIAQVVGLAAG